MAAIPVSADLQTEAINTYFPGQDNLGWLSSYVLDPLTEYGLLRNRWSRATVVGLTTFLLLEVFKPSLMYLPNGQARAFAPMVASNDVLARRQATYMPPVLFSLLAATLSVLLV